MGMNDMRYNTLGKSGLKVSVIGFGGIPIQRVSPGDCSRVLSKCAELGVNFIDSARGYTVSEEYIGRAIQGRRSDWVLATKSFSRENDAARADIDASLKNFRTDYIDLYQMHNIMRSEDLDRALADGGLYSVYDKARRDGKIGHIGVTSHSVDVALEAVNTGLFETLMIPYNIVETQAEELIKKAAQLGVGVIAMKPMAGGALEDGRLARKYILQNKDISCAIPGMADIREVEINAAAADDISPLTEDEKAQISAIQSSLGGEFCRRCGYCGPCPQGINIPYIFMLSGYKNRYDLAAWAVNHYFNEKVRANACAECGICETRCPYGLPIRKMLKEVRKIFNE